MRRRALLLACYLWLGFHPLEVIARPIHYWSIELITAESDAVVRGTIMEITQLHPKEGSYDPYRFKLRIRVTETLKGPKINEISVASDCLDPKYDLWRKEKTEVLFNLQQLFGSGVPCPFKLLWFQGTQVIEPDGSGRGVVTMDFQVLTKRAEILKAAQCSRHDSLQT